MNNERSTAFIKSLITIVATAAVVFVITSSYYINNVVAGKDIDYKEYEHDEKFAKLEKVLELIKTDFLFDDYTMEDLENGAIRGILGALDDPYTSYFDAKETEEFLIESEGDYEGVGMYVTFGKDIEWPMVLSVIKNSPAEEVGVQAGDYIYSINDTSINKNMSLEEVASILKGESGTKVTVTFIRIDDDGKQEEYTYEIERRKIEVNSFEYEIKNENIGYMKFNSFDEYAGNKFKNAYDELVNQNKVKGIIIDIRNNPGGLLTTAMEIADRLVPTGLITYTVDKNGNKKPRFSDSLCSDVPIVILVNENSASASEILASAVKDHGVGKIVGKTSYGKGLVQSFVSLGDGTYAKITIAEYFSPKGTKINKIGVIPDYEVDDNIETEDDEQLEKALEVIKNF